MSVELSFDGPVAIITWNDGENRLNPDSLAELMGAFDELDAVSGPLAVVWTGTGKYFSNGLDLERFSAHPEQLGPTSALLHQLFARVLVFPAYTIAAVNGHAFAGGAMLTCTVDHRIMREDRGYWCLNEVEIGLPLTEGMAELVLGRIPAPAAREAMLTARRYSAADALAAGIVEETAPEIDVLPRAVERAHVLATKDRTVVAIHKRLAFSRIAERILSH